MIEQTSDLKRKLRDIFSDEPEPIEHVADYDLKQAGEVLIPFSQEKFFKEARKEEGKYVRMANIKRFNHRIFAIYYALLMLGLMLYNAFSNQSQMLRGGQMSDAETSQRMQLENPAYNSAMQKKDLLLNGIESEVRAHDEKIAYYRNRGEQGRVTYWLEKRNAAEARRASALSEFDQTMSTIKQDADRAVTVHSDYIFHRLFAFALPVLVFLCAFGAERSTGVLRWSLIVCMFILMLPNAYLISGGIYYMFPNPKIIAPLLGETSPMGLVMFFVVMFGEPAGYYVCSMQMRKHLEMWHELLDSVVQERNRRIQLRGSIRSDLRDSEIEAIETASTIAEKQNEYRDRVLSKIRDDVQQRKQVKIDNLEAVKEVHAATEQTANDLIMPRADSSTQLANLIIDMEEAGTIITLRARGISNSDIARANDIQPGTLRAELSRLNKKRKNDAVQADDTQDSEVFNDESLEVSNG